MNYTNKIANIFEKFINYILQLELILWMLGVYIIGAEIYRILTDPNTHFDTVFSPIIGAAMVVLATIMRENNKSKTKREILFSKAAILNELRQHGEIQKSKLLSQYSLRFKTRYILAAITELQAENLIMVKEEITGNIANHSLLISIVDSSTFNNSKYEIAQTLRELDRKISFPKKLSYDINKLAINPRKHSIEDINKLLGRIRETLDTRKQK